MLLQLNSADRLQQQSKVTRLRPIEDNDGDDYANNLHTTASSIKDKPKPNNIDT